MRELSHSVSLLLGCELCGEGPSGCAKKVSSELQWCGACAAPETISMYWSSLTAIMVLELCKVHNCWMVW